MVNQGYCVTKDIKLLTYTWSIARDGLHHRDGLSASLKGARPASLLEGVTKVHLLIDGQNSPLQIDLDLTTSNFLIC